jgi:hypothetical protein
MLEKLTNQINQNQYKYLKKSIDQFKGDLENLRVNIKSIPDDNLIELMADVVAIKENIAEVLEKEFLKNFL